MAPRPLLTLVASALVLVSAAACLSSGGAGDAARPSILLLVGDDHGRADAGCYGNSDARTPNLDRLAAEGARFTGMHAVTAICQPSRAALFTGRYPISTGVYGFYPLDRDVEPLSALLADAGYDCGLVGKQHIAPLDRYRFTFTAPLSKDEGRDMARYVQGTREFLDEKREDAPFFLVVAFHDPHRPFPTTGVDSGPAAEVPGGVDRAALRVPDGFPDTPAVREDVGGYLDAIGRLDAGVGGVLSLLEERGLLDDTLVVYTSDHGPPFPFAKTTLYGRGLAVPFLVRWPGRVAPGTIESSLFSLVDVAPTLLEAAGESSPREVEGTSFLPDLLGVADRGRAWIFASQTDHLYLPSTPMRSVADARFRYIYNFINKRMALKNIRKLNIYYF